MSLWSSAIASPQQPPPRDGTGSEGSYAQESMAAPLGLWVDSVPLARRLSARPSLSR